MPQFTTLDNVKQWLRITADTSDAVLSRLIVAASTFIETKLSRNILSTEYSEMYNGPGGCTLPLPNTPVTEVSSLVVNGRSVPRASSGSAAAAGYTFDRMAVYMVGGYRVWRGFQNVSVVYTAGFAAVPSDIEQVCIELVALKFKEMERIGQQSKSVAGQTVTYHDGDLTPVQRDVLSSYARKAPLL